MTKHRDRIGPTAAGAAAVIVAAIVLAVIAIEAAKMKATGSGGEAHATATAPLR